MDNPGLIYLTGTNSRLGFKQILGEQISVRRYVKNTLIIGQNL